MLSVALAAALLPVFAVAENVFTVNVAQGGQLNFSPANVDNVQNGDVIQFVFDGPNHSVTQSTLAQPCTALQGGFSSGFSTAAGEVWNLTISDASKPIWYFCAQSTPLVHCEKGMVGAVNSQQDAFNSFSANAASATDTPSQSVNLSGSGAAATASPVSAAVVSGTAPAASGSGGSSGSGSSTGSAAPTQSSSAAMPFAGLEGAGAAVLAFFGAMLL
ncbi:uncharacterized protein FOMMEDRAFT_20202 [Fomitiporia mediterranea MF3/22]|uniref:uncharacterized protein n=1 Tax=Fomitiporia mediterranea (strain MF3/22) TaxID=694068 RepID=UPI00044090AC|nr:uncharacterized protein FOMMEDRAFT_20202 [Fomitiporia mediterranea MF3/22]EJD03030.1 hypothetical protein FOMMEDRAFT_20202 [Fomitiporia mediterranea MF3/22]